LNTFRREHDRFWVLAAHPTLNIFAAGLRYTYSHYKIESTWMFPVQNVENRRHAHVIIC